MRKISSILYLVFLALSTTVIGILGIPALLHRPAARGVARLWCRVNLAALRPICGIKSVMHGEAHLRTAPSIIAAKHQSMWETLKLYAELDYPIFVLKKELRAIPVFGFWCARLGFIFVNRSDGGAALRKMVVEAKARMAAGARHLVIFPEGTRVGVGEHKTYQPGVAALAKSLALPVIPVAHNSGQFWLTPGPEKCPGTIELQAMEAIPADTPRKVLMARLEADIEAAASQLAGLETQTKADSSHAVPAPKAAEKA